ncbi:hypothetical protein PIB30_014179 [Stylosanthes scabra]|uniref:Uncharacterized protein n=1 Tax=Stylosanthes scabra TaxID=79078 RepID=A0ABU6V650_9FABA|nr:hypothetical protein [Stylosanthes scabra]
MTSLSELGWLPFTFECTNHAVGYMVLTTSVDIMDHEEARRKNIGVIPPVIEGRNSKKWWKNYRQKFWTVIPPTLILEETLILQPRRQTKPYQPLLSSPPPNQPLLHGPPPSPKPTPPNLPNKGGLISVAASHSTRERWVTADSTPQPPPPRPSTDPNFSLRSFLPIGAASKSRVIHHQPPYSSGFQARLLWSQATSESADTASSDFQPLTTLSSRNRRPSSSQVGVSPLAFAAAAVLPRWSSPLVQVLQRVFGCSVVKKRCSYSVAGRRRRSTPEDRSSRANSISFPMFTLVLFTFQMLMLFVFYIFTVSFSFMDNLASNCKNNVLEYCLDMLLVSLSLSEQDIHSIRYSLGHVSIEQRRHGASLLPRVSRFSFSPSSHLSDSDRGKFGGGGKARRRNAVFTSPLFLNDGVDSH